MDRNLPAVVELDEDEGAPLEPRQNISVAFLPLALVAFTVLAFVLAAWTFLAASGT
ncbi:MAG: hypothetical protein ACRDGJ_11805 [Candidatus Limnocylindria bacterium]